MSIPYVYRLGSSILDSVCCLIYLLILILSLNYNYILNKFNFL
jgi:hypothetical protein